MSPQGSIKSRRFIPPQATPSAQHSPTPSYTKLPGLFTKKTKTEDVHSVVKTEDVHTKTSALPSDLHIIANTPAILRARSHSMARMSQEQRSLAALVDTCQRSHSITTCSNTASTSAPALSGEPEDTDIITDANFTARRHTRADQCLAHPMTFHACDKDGSACDTVGSCIAAGSAPCDCEVIERID